MDLTVYIYIYIYPLAFGLPAAVPQPGFAVVLWQNQISTAFLALFKSRGECCPNFDMGHSLADPKSIKNHYKFHQKFIKNHKKLVLGVALGIPGVPLGAPLGAWMAKNMKK